MNTTKLGWISIGATVALAGAGCGHRTPPPAPMAPPMSGQVSQAPPVGGYNGGAPTGQGVYNWQDVPAGQNIPVTQASFDQGGYQIVAQSGETIVVPFVNQNLYVMKFGRSFTGQTYFVNEGSAPTLYLPQGQGIANAAAQGAMWYPIPNDFNYTRPMYVGLAPTWNDYIGMGWYPGMMAYGGLFGYSPFGYSTYSYMPGFSIMIGGRSFSNYVTYRNYYTSRGGYVPNRVVYKNYNVGRSAAGFGSSRTSSSGFGSRRAGGGSFGSRPSGSVGSSGFGQRSGNFGGGSFSSGRSSSSGTSGFGGRSSNGTFGSRPFGGSSGASSYSGGSSGFGASRPSSGSFGGTRSFGGDSSSGGSSFGGTRRYSGSSGGSFGGGRSFGGSSSGGSSFGSGRSSGSSFGGSRSSGSSSFGGRRR